MTKETINSDLRKAVIYCRVSTKEQVDEGNSLVSQERLCREYAFKEGYEIVEIFIEKGESAKTADRKELQRMLAFCTAKKDTVQAVIAYKVDRISRNIADYSWIKVRLKKFNVDIKSVTEYFEDTPAGRFMENIIANVGQFDNEVRIERCMGGMKEAVQEGRYVWKAPLGYDNVRVDNKATIAPNSIAPLITEAFELIAQRHYSTDVIRLMMKEKGLVGRDGGPVNKSYFFRLVRNPLYKGILTQFGTINKGTFKPLVAEHLFDYVQAILKGRKNKIKHYQRENPDFPLRRFVVNEEGKQLTGYWAKGKYKKYAYYSFHLPGTTIGTRVLENLFMEFLAQFAFDTCHLNLFRDYLEKHFGKRQADSEVASKAITERIDEVNKEIEFLFTTHRKGNISEGMFTNRITKLEDELEDLTHLMAVKKTETVDAASLFRFAAKLLTAPHIAWQQSPLEIRRKLQEFYFPKGIIFNGDKLRTLKVCNVFKLKQFFDRPKFSIVDSSNLGNNTVPTHAFTSLNENMFKSKDFWEDIKDELINLQKQLH